MIRGGQGFDKAFSEAFSKNRFLGWRMNPVAIASGRYG
jgi:hypothetical protein